ncbi:MAG: hypothetical protein H6862_04035 [Rhodospirillales bacterium]|nr:hypothetical protein [Rhodospirillales bacterium]
MAEQKPPPPKDEMDEAAGRVQEARQEGRVLRTPGQPTPEQIKEMEAIINGLSEPESAPVTAWERPDNADLAKREKEYYQFRENLRQNQNEAIDRALNEGRTTEENAAKARAQTHQEFLERTSPDAMKASVRNSVGAEMVDSRTDLTPEKYESELNQITKDYESSPERAAWEQEYGERRQADLETGKKLNNLANGHLPDSEPSKAMENAKEGNQRIKSLADGETLSPRPEPVAPLAPEPALPNKNAFDQAHESAAKINEMANPKAVTQPSAPERKIGAFEQAGRSTDAIKALAEQYHNERMAPLAEAEKAVVNEGIQKTTAAENVARAAELENKLADAGVQTPPPPPGSVREKVVNRDLAGATAQAAENQAKAPEPVEPVAAAAEPKSVAPETPKAPESPHAPALPEGGIPRAATAGGALEAAGLKGKGNLATAGVVGLGVAAYSLTEGASAAEAGKAGLDAANPYAGTLNTALDENTSKLDVATAASHDTATLAGSTAGALAGAQAFGSAGAVLGPAGAAAGAVIGGIAGGIAGGAAVDATIKHGQEAYDAAVDATSRGIEAVANAGSAAMDGASRAWDGAKNYIFGENKNDVSKPAGEEAPAPGASADSTLETSKAPDPASSDRSTASASRNDGQGIDAPSPKTAFNDNAAGKPDAPAPEPAPEPKPDPVASNEEKYTTSSPSAPAMA